MAEAPRLRRLGFEPDDRPHSARQLAMSAFSRDFRTFSVQFSEHERRRHYVRGLLTGGDSAAWSRRARTPS